jgi:hypothetical protein
MLINLVASLLRKIVGRIKRIMSQSIYWITVAMMVIPLSWAIMFWGFDKNNMGLVFGGFLMFLIGASFWGGALYNLKKERKEEKKRQEAVDVQQATTLAALQGVIEQLKEMKDKR